MDFQNICKVRYRFGFNGQEKTDEISGAGNHNTALFWEYDTRLGRRWNLDPKPNASISEYSSFMNNPIFYSDPLGDTVKVRGEVSIGPPTEFALNVRNAISTVTSQSNTASNIYNDLHNSEFVYNIEPGENSGFIGEHGRTIRKSSEQYGTYKPGGGTVTWNSSGDGGVFEQSEMNSISNSSEVNRPEVNLFHELAHANDMRKGLLKEDGSRLKGLKINEWRATNTENIIRSEMNIPLRTYYNTISSGSTKSPAPPALLKMDNKTIISRFNYLMNLPAMKYRIIK